MHRLVAERRTTPTRSGRKPRGVIAPIPEQPAAEPSLPNARQRAWQLVQLNTALDAVACAAVRIDRDATVRAVADPVRRFIALVRASGVSKPVVVDRDAVAEFHAWITIAKACGAPYIAMFPS